MSLRISTVSPESLLLANIQHGQSCRLNPKYRNLDPLQSYENTFKKLFYVCLIRTTIYLTPFHTDGLAQTNRYNKHDFVHLVFKGVAGQIFYNMIFFVPEDCFYLGKQYRPW